MTTQDTSGRKRHHLLLAAALIAALSLGGCKAVRSLLSGGGSPTVQLADGVTDASGVGRVTSAAGVVDFQAVSGQSGEHVAGVKLEVAVIGHTELLRAEDPAGLHYTLVVPLAGNATVRRVVMPPLAVTGYNITTAAGPLDLSDLTPLGTLAEADIRDRLSKGPDDAVLLYLYNPARPLALTGAPLEAYSTPFDGVTVLRAAGEPPDAQLALVVVTLTRSAFATWSNLNVDRYLAGRIGQPPDVDLRADLAFHWAYPVFDVYPSGSRIDLGIEDQTTLKISWRSQNADPPPPWTFFVKTDDAHVQINPESFPLAPNSAPVDVTISVDRSNLPVGDYSATLYIQPFSDAFGLIQQQVEITLAYSVAEALPTATPAPAPDALFIMPQAPRQGDTLHVVAQGFKPNETVLFELIGSERSIRDSLPTADAGGQFTYDVDLATVPPGDYTLRLVGTQSGKVGTATVTVAEAIPDAVVVTDELNLREGPGYDYDVTEVLVKGDSLQAISTNYNNSWMQVEAPDGKRGWIVVDLVQLNVKIADVPFDPVYGRAP